MISRLVDSLRLLAAPAEPHLAQQSALADRPDALAREFADAYVLICDCPQIRLTPAQQRWLDRVDTLLQRTSEGAELRNAAQNALRELGDTA